jgi:hypothetical protein
MTSEIKIKSESIIDSCTVIDKIKPVFVCDHIKNTETDKSGRTGLKYLAVPELNPNIIDLLKECVPYKVTAKVDGTSILVMDNKLLKRRDQKLNKKTGKKKTMPDSWQMTGKSTETHGVGYMPLEKGDKWFFDIFEKDSNNPDDVDKIGHPLIDGELSTRVRIIKFTDHEENKENEGRKLEYKFEELSNLNNKSFELMGPKFQGNLHLFEHHTVMEHGLINLPNYPKLENGINETEDLLNQIKFWQDSDKVGQIIEGVVVHFESGQMFKLHRHHLDLKWGNLDERMLPLFDLEL